MLHTLMPHGDILDLASIGLAAEVIRLQVRARRRRQQLCHAIRFAIDRGRSIERERLSRR